jgi:excisionase family DNA binding protein
MDNKIESLDEDKFLIGCVQAMASEIDDENIIENDPLTEGMLVGDIEAAALEGDKEGSIISHIRSRRSAWTADELASLFEISSKTIYKMAATGRIPSFRIGGTVRFDPHATAEWLEPGSSTKTS